MRAISPRQFGTLNYFHDNPTPFSKLGEFHQGTLASMLNHGWLIRKKRASDGETIYSLSPEGNSQLHIYRLAPRSERLKAGPMTEYASSLLSLARLVRK